MTDAELIAKWRPVLDATAHIFSWSGEAELAYWAECATEAKEILEVGSHFGRSAKVMALANPTANIWCVDNWAQDGTFHTFKHFLADEIKAERLFTTKGEAMYGLGHLYSNGLRFNLVLLDNGHQCSELMDQIPAAQNLLLPGGLLCGHDLDRNPDNGVTMAVTKLLPRFDEPVSRVWAWRKP